MEKTTLQMLINLVKEGSAGGKRYCFILGAGASRASGIKTGAEMAKIWLEELEKLEDEATKEWIEEEKIVRDNPGDHYPKIYGRRFRTAPTNGFISLQKELKNAIPSPGYYHLAKILAKTDNNLVITTNFDSLTEDSLFIYEDIKALVITHESLAKYIDVYSNRPTVIKLHRDLLLQPKSDEAGVNSLPEEWGEGLKKIMEIYFPIVIGYGGNDGSLMGFLEKVSSKDRYIYWCHRKDPPVNDRIKSLLENCNGFSVLIDDFDDTMQLFGEAFDFVFSEKTIRDVINDRADKLIDKNNELNADRLKVLSKKGTKSTTENMTFDNLKSARERRIAALLSSIAKDCGNADNYSKLGTEYFWDEQYDKAEEYYTEAIKLDPGNAKYYQLRGVSYNWLKEYEKAVADHSKAIELDPDKASYYNSRGKNYNWLKEYEKAVADHSKAIELDPGNAAYYNSRGVNYNWLKEYEKAVADHSKAIDIEPDKADYYNERGKNYNWLNEYEKAVADYSKAVELEPDNALYYTGLARMLCKIGNVDGALDNLNKALSLNDNLPECYNVRGYVKLKIAKRAKIKCELDVLSDLNKAVDLKGEGRPNNRFYADRAEYYLYSGEYDNAYKDLRKILDHNDRYGRAYYFLAMYYRTKENKQEYENCMAKSKDYRFIPDDDD
jgi:tetratricopeptide (TPR) repeat protein